MLSDAEHVSGTNKYTFTFSPHWRRIVNQRLSIAVRSVKLWLAPRLLRLNGLSITNGTATWNISPRVILDGEWSALNKELEKDRALHVEALTGDEFGSSSYSITYDPSSDRLIIGVTTTASHYLIIDEGFYVSDDLKYMVCCPESELWNDLSKLTRGSMGKDEFEALWGDRVVVVCNDSGEVIKIAFTKLVPRGDLNVCASFVDMAFHQYLGATNEQFIPPKEYNINYGDQKFWIALSTIDGKEVELAPDNRDQLTIEAMMCSG